MCAMSKIFCAVKKAVDEWNPYSLLPLSPDDEFDVESEMISSMLNENSGETEIAQAVSQVFSKMFEPELFKIDDCVGVAQAIKNNIEEFCKSR